MGVRVKKHKGDHKWVVKDRGEICKRCKDNHHGEFPMRVRWVCSIEGCGAKFVQRHQHID